MRSRSRLVAGLGIGVLVSGVGLLAAVPAGAHTDLLYTVSEQVVDEVGADFFSTISKTDASVTPLPTAVTGDLRIAAIEIYNEIGYAVGERGEDDEEEEVVITWDHVTGAVLSVVPVVAGGVGIEAIYGLDTVVNGQLPNGTLIVFVGSAEDDEWIGSIDPTTGVVTPLIDLTDRPSAEFLDALATDPTTGISYAKDDEDNGVPEYLVLDFAGSTFTGPFELLSIVESLDTGSWIRGADFDNAGVLWFTYDDLLASTVGAFGPDVTAVSSGVYPEIIENSALAIDPGAAAPLPAPEPQLAATGSSTDGIVLGALALILAGGLALVVSRRRATV